MSNMNRSRLLLYEDIFGILADAGVGGIGKTSLMQKANLEYRKLVAILSKLKEAGLISEMKDVDFNSSTAKTSITLTSDGLEYKKKLDEFVKFADSFGLSI